MVYDTQNEDPERGEYRSLYSDQGTAPSLIHKNPKTNPTKDEDGDEQIKTPSTTPLHTQPRTPTANAKSEPKPNNSRRRPWAQFPQNLRPSATNEVKTIAKAVFGALGFIICILVCTFSIITLIYCCTEFVNGIRHVGDPSPYDRFSHYKGYVTVDDDIDDPYPYPSSVPLDNDNGDMDTVPEATTTESGIEVACIGEAGACGGSLSELMRIPKATRVAIITDGKWWSDIEGEDVDADFDADVDVDFDRVDDIQGLSSDYLRDEEDCENYYTREKMEEQEYGSVFDRLWNGLFGV
ncbi:uncharacterized protein ACHE_50489S [Aspergillus chevalieri]|uniref:Uncharacterized protein n=1 Tax=Aspergillus chevalieri TaxID=182096 RepID=A0A7R7VR56_ASPCH|nr:uncharacterized protein ACHE_50489S [Aspergillus chevalieri]BCR89291.1 hypothetical protein ACHE_50489S [Aspergillus chevalieri]